MRPSRPRLRLLCPRLAWLLGFVLLVGLSGCGPAPSDHAPSLEPRASLGGPSKSPPVSQHSPSTHHDPFTPAASPAHDARAQTAASPADTPPPDEQTTAERAQREARQLWFAEVREHPDVTVRLQALEVWAQQPGDALDPVTYALVDGDEHVRARAQELWEQQLTREAATTQPVQEEGPGGQAER
jgi:hypothetical protein